jgi:hypothetical protein
MRKSTIAGMAVAGLLVVLSVTGSRRELEPEVAAAAEDSPVRSPSTVALQGGLLYGRVVTDDGTTYQGRLRWGGDEEALWGNHFNGRKAENPWAEYVPPGQLPVERSSVTVFGIKIPGLKRPVDLSRPFLAHFGDIEGIEPRGRDLRVTLKSGAEFHLDRYAADDLADGVRVWDENHGVLDIGEWRIRSIEFLDPPLLDGIVRPLHGTVQTVQGAFTGFVQWDRELCLGSDELVGRTAEGELRIPFDRIRAIARLSHDSSRVTLHDGRAMVLSGDRRVGEGNRGLYVDDPRYGRVLVSWDAFESVEFSPGEPGPTYREFPPGRPLTGSVITRSGRRLVGRLVYDLDESETTETLDAPFQGVDYLIPFGRVASIVLPGLDMAGARPARVTLVGGEELPLELTGDLGQGNAGVLVFSGDQERPEYVPWSEVQRVDFDGPEVEALSDAPD